MAFYAIKWLIFFLVVVSLQGTSSTSTPITKSNLKTTTIGTTKSTKPTPSTVKPSEESSNNTTETENLNVNDQNIVPTHKDNKGLLKRMLYVAIGFSVIVALYFIVKTIRTKARKSKSKKYGMIYSSGDVEMQPLENDDDEEDDMTVFDRKTRK